MNRICVFYHCILSGGSVPIVTPFACELFAEQMRALKDSGLLAACDELHIGINGGYEDLDLARMFAPAKARFIVHGAGATTEIPTMACLRNWLPGHEGWKVLYHHMKSISHPGEIFYDNWRRRMEKYCVWGWRECVAQLDNGVEACGCHFLTPEQFPKLVKSPFFGGTFWWSTVEFLKTLPPLPSAVWANRFEAESWIGKGPRRPKVKDFYPGWP